MKYECKTCCDTKTIKVRYSDCGGYMHGKCPPSHAGKFVRCHDCTQEKPLPIDRKTGKVACSDCNEALDGKIIISYTFEGKTVKDTFFYHKRCHNRIEAIKKNLNIPCPKCQGEATTRRKQIDCDDDCFNPRFGCSANHRPYIIEAACHFCDGEGYLANQPIPVITEWRKAP